jgi:hypothetical protein
VCAVDLHQALTTEPGQHAARQAQPAFARFVSSVFARCIKEKGVHPAMAVANRSTGRAGTKVWKKSSP